MNQTKKRLTIINLAISITDIETIQLQIQKLALLKSDLKIAEIVSTLKEENYAQAQGLITEYIEAPNETVVQRTIQDNIPTQDKEKRSKEEEDQAIIEEFDLFTTPAYETSSQLEEVNYDAFLETPQSDEITSTKEVNYDPLLNVVANDILPNNIDLDISQNTDTEDTIVNEHIESTSEDSVQETIKDENNQHIPIVNEKTHIDTENRQNIPTSGIDITGDEYSEENDTAYEAIAHINTKFNNLYTQYPPIEYTENRYYSVENWLLQISTKGYTEIEIETRIEDAQKVKNTNLAEAAQLIIAAGATDSLYALFQLARALFIGDILQKNVPEAVTLIHYLAINEEFPEAICDLAQFYEQGIEVKKDRKKAEELYKEAMHLGIQRATKHFQRIQKENKSIFSRFKSKL